MPSIETAEDRISEIGIFARILANGKPMSADLAEYVLTLGFDEADQARMEDLAARNQQDELSSAEHDELMAFVRASHLLALLHAKARLAIKKTTS
jgi:hypothetical protein